MLQKTLKVALGDLRHNTIGRHSIYVPIGIGYIGSYLLSKFDPGRIDLRLYADLNSFIKDIEEWKPDVIGLSNYCWNASASHLICKTVKRNFPGTLCVLGGPEFPKDNEKRKEYLSERSSIDAYIYGDGEAAFAGLINSFLEKGMDVNLLKSEPNDGTISINPETGELIVGKFLGRFEDLDTIPSPYLSGLLDKWLSQDYQPAIQTQRGCPYKCFYCHTSADKFFNAFSVQRIKDELTYIVRNTKDIQKKALCIFDSNFGMYRRDVEIATHLGDIMEQYDWPLKIEASAGKSNIKRLLDVLTRLKNRMTVGLSLQTLNLKTCTLIGRQNISMKQYVELFNELKSRGQHPSCELIMPMPEETKESYLEGQKTLMNIGISTGTYTTMMLKGTPLASKEFREKYQMKTKYRILPRQFGEYFGEKCFEIEEVCIGTNTMSFDDYLECRGFSLLVEMFSSEQFDIIHRHLKELSISFYEYLCKIMYIIKSENVCLTEVYKGFNNEIREELFGSEKDICEFFSKQENYKSLLNAEKGDNLLRKFLTKAHFIEWEQLLNFAYSTLIKCKKEKLPQNILESLDAAKQWTLATRNITTVLQNESVINQIETLKLSYDILSWYEGGKSSSPLMSFKNTRTYRIFYDKDNVSRFIQSCRILWGDDNMYLFGSMFSRGWKLSNLWCTCRQI